MRPRCLLFVSALAFAPTAPRAVEEPRMVEKPRAVELAARGDPAVERECRKSPNELCDVGRRLYDAGDYRNAIVAYSQWVPRMRCGIGSANAADEKLHRTALCYSHLNDHVAAAQTCLRATIGTPYFDGSERWVAFLIQLYREAGQLDDLPRVVHEFHYDELAALVTRPGLSHADVRNQLSNASFALFCICQSLSPNERAKVAPWPVGVPKPKPGSLPKALP